LRRIKRKALPKEACKGSTIITLNCLAVGHVKQTPTYEIFKQASSPRPAQAPGSAASMIQFDEEQTQSPPTAQRSRSGVEENSRFEKKNTVGDICMIHEVTQ
jgi:hypothetical protein